MIRGFLYLLCSKWIEYVLNKYKNLRIKISKINWANKLIKSLKLIYFFITLDLSNFDLDTFNYLSTGEKIIYGILAFVCIGIGLWTVTHDKDFYKKLEEMDDYNDKWRRQWKNSNCYNKKKQGSKKQDG